MKLSEKIWDAWERASATEKEAALADYLHQGNGLYARLWIDTNPNAERIIWATVDVSENSNISPYEQNVVLLASRHTSIFEDFGEAENLGEYVKKYEIPRIENEIIYDQAQNKAWDLETE